MNNLPYLLALNHITGVGPKIVARLRQKWPDLSHLFQLKSHQLRACGLSEALAERISQFDMRAVEEDLQWNEHDGCHLLSIESPEYPALLKEIPDSPTMLYARGNLHALRQPAIAIVGSRKPSISGEKNAFEFSRDLARAGCAVISGLALGIDAKAHQGCLSVNGVTVAVMGTGMQHIYPRRHQKLASDIQQNGLIISEFPLKTPPKAGHFPRRNRIISGLSLATLVVEATIRSGSLITARLALEQNREVLSIPGSIHNPAAKGCHYLLQQGAKLVTQVEDILEELHIYNPIAVQELSNPSPGLASEAQKLVKFLGFDLSTVDEICQRSGLTIENTGALLAELELQGVVQAVMGGYIKV